jgi:hypothetical protein
VSAGVAVTARGRPAGGAPYQAALAVAAAVTAGVLADELAARRADQVDAVLTALAIDRHDQARRRSADGPALRVVDSPRGGLLVR